jgi:hypothetical protein
VDREDGQSTVEWVGLVSLVALVVVALGTIAGIAIPGAALARAIGGRLLCALALDDECGDLGASDLALAYGDEIAALVAQTAPQIRYEPGMKALPIDYRDCREDACAEGRDGVRVARTTSGRPAVAFTHVVDCRAGSESGGAACTGAAAGNVYVQFWLYYPGSATGEGSTILRGVIREVSADVGHPSYHPDDWESVQYRIHPDGSADVRASSHRGYGDGWRSAASSAYTVSGGSHAGSVEPAEFDRITTPRRLGLIPFEPIADEHPNTQFAITPPWRKRVWLDPEYGGTD